MWLHRWWERACVPAGDQLLFNYTPHSWLTSTLCVVPVAMHSASLHWNLRYALHFKCNWQCKIKYDIILLQELTLLQHENVVALLDCKVKLNLNLYDNYQFIEYMYTFVLFALIIIWYKRHIFMICKTSFCLILCLSVFILSKFPRSYQCKLYISN